MLPSSPSESTCCPAALVRAHAAEYREPGWCPCACMACCLPACCVVACVSARCLPACCVVFLHVYQLAKTRVCAVRAVPIGTHVDVTDHSRVQRQSPPHHECSVRAPHPEFLYRNTMLMLVSFTNPRQKFRLRGAIIFQNYLWIDTPTGLNPAG